VICLLEFERNVGFLNADKVSNDQLFLKAPADMFAEMFIQVATIRRNKLAVRAASWGTSNWRIHDLHQLSQRIVVEA